MKKLFALLLLFAFKPYFTQEAVKVYEKVNDAVVRIIAYNSDHTSQSQGSGVIVKEKGWIITNYHVLGNAEIIQAEHKGLKIVLDSIVAMDKDKDVLILQLNKVFLAKHSKEIPDIKIGNTKKLKVGQKIYAIGSPYDFENTMTDGIISGLRSSFDSSKKFIQISAPISSGSSGGAIVNSKGELIGISTMIVSGGTAQNLNFALLIDEVIETSQMGKKPNTASQLSLLRYYFHNGKKDFYERKFSSSIVNFKQALKYSNSEENTATVLYYTGLAFHKLNHLDSAIIYYNKSIHINKVPETYVAIGMVSLDNKDYNNAIIFFEYALKLDPNFNEALVAMGKAYYLKKDNVTSITYLRMAVRLVPNNPKALYLIGHLSYESGKTDLALYFYNQAIFYNPNYAEAYLALSVVYKDSGDIFKSQQYKKRALEIDPDVGK